MITDRHGRVAYTPTELMYAIQRGDLADVSMISLRGYNPDVDAAAEDLIPWGGNYAFQTAAVPMEVISTSIADDGSPAGTGLHTALVSGLDNSFLPISETVTLNGTTAVPLVNSYRRINSFVGLAAGSGEFNAGTVSCRVTAGAVVQAQMDIGKAISRHGVYTVQTGKTAYIHRIIASILRSTSDYLEVELVLRGPSASLVPVRITINSIALAGQSASTVFGDGNDLPIVGPYDVILRSTGGSANNNGVLGTVFMILEDS